MDTAPGAKPKHHEYQFGRVHFVLSHSYTVFLFAVVLGIILDIIVPTNLINSHSYQYIGSILIILGSLLSYWAQSSSRHSKEEMKNNIKRDFMKGPYKYSRQPTHIGLTLLSLGLGFVVGSIYTIIFTIAASLITKFVFVRREEALLAQEYGQDYLDYKKKVKAWI